MDIPVCGNNGYLYKNYCSLLNDQCETNQYINIIDYGTCPMKKRRNRLTSKLNYINQLNKFLT